MTWQDNKVTVRFMQVQSWHIIKKPRADPLCLGKKTVPRVCILKDIKLEYYLMVGTVRCYTGILDSIHTSAFQAVTIGLSIASIAYDPYRVFSGSNNLGSDYPI